MDEMNIRRSVRQPGTPAGAGRCDAWTSQGRDRNVGDQLRERDVLKFIRRLRGGPAPEPFTAPIETGGRVIYAIGDIHGRYDLLDQVLERILSDAAASPGAPRIVFLGDYIDRGEGARQTLDLLVDFAARREAEPVFLMGNHEQMLLRFLDDPAAGERWLRFGGLQTLVSYGVAAPPSLRDSLEALRVRADLSRALGQHLDFLKALCLSHRAGNILFTHAGADPAVAAEEQEAQTLLWGSERFLAADRQDGIWVAHGHFVVDQPSAERGRIALDTGAYFSGRLTAARIVDGDVTFLETEPGSQLGDS